jgi:hypothetical protein
MEVSPKHRGVARGWRPEWWPVTDLSNVIRVQDDERAALFEFVGAVMAPTGAAVLGYSEGLTAVGEAFVGGMARAMAELRIRSGIGLWWGYARGAKCVPRFSTITIDSAGVGASSWAAFRPNTLAFLQLSGLAKDAARGHGRRC